MTKYATAEAIHSRLDFLYQTLIKYYPDEPGTHDEPDTYDAFRRELSKVLENDGSVSDATYANVTSSFRRVNINAHVSANDTGASVETEAEAEAKAAVKATYKGFDGTYVRVDNIGARVDSIHDGIMRTYLTETARDRFTSVIMLSCIYCLASEFLTKHGNTQAAAKSLETASRYCEEADSDAATGYHVDTPPTRKGGQKKAEKAYGPIKKTVCKLIAELCPEGGWQSKEAAINSIIENIFSPHSDEPPPLTWNNAPKTLQRWFRENPEIRAAYESAATPKKQPAK